MFYEDYLEVIITGVGGALYLLSADWLILFRSFCDARSLVDIWVFELLVSSVSPSEAGIDGNTTGNHYRVGLADL